MRLRYAYIVLKSLQKHCQTVFSRFLAMTLGNLWGVQNFQDFLRRPVALKIQDLIAN
jgi:hypothetical protein